MTILYDVVMQIVKQRYFIVSGTFLHTNRLYMLDVFTHCNCINQLPHIILVPLDPPLGLFEGPAWVYTYCKTKVFTYRYFSTPES